MHCTEMCLNTCFRKSNRGVVDKAGNLQCRDEPCFMSLIAIKSEMDSINKRFWLFNHTTGACYYTEDCSYATQANTTSRLYNPIFQSLTIWHLISSAMWSVPWSQSQFKSRWMRDRWSWWCGVLQGGCVARLVAWCRGTHTTTCTDAGPPPHYPTALPTFCCHWFSPTLLLAKDFGSKSLSLIEDLN